MDSGDSSTRPPRGRAPYPRSRGSVGNDFIAPARRIVDSGQPFARPVERPAQFVSPAAPSFTPPVSVTQEAPAEPITVPTPEPVFQRPQPIDPPQAPIAPASTPQLEQPPAAIDDLIDELVATTPDEQQNQFAPPEVVKKPKKRLKLPKLRISKRVRFAILGVIVLIAASGGLYSILRWTSTQNSPQHAFQEALNASFTTSNVRVTSETGNTKSAVTFDLRSSNNVTTSSQATITQAGSLFGIETFGTPKATYLSYKSLPTAISPQTKTAATGWVQLRSDGAQPAGVPRAIAQIVDPRYQTVGLVPFAHLSERLRDQSIRYVAEKSIYGYDEKAVTTTTYAGLPVLAYTVSPNINYLKLLNQTVASAEGFTITDTQTAVGQLDALKQARVTMYVSKKSHQFVGATITKKGVSTSLSYSYTNVDAGNEPQTKLQWQAFAPLQIQLESQAAARQTAADIDAVRTTNLATIHTVLAHYFTENNSYPSIGNLNDPVWLAENLPELDPAALREPLATTAILSPAPKATSYAYKTTSTIPNLACDNTPANQCAHYVLTALLHTGQPFSVQDP